MHIRYRPDIDGLRAIAVGAVLLFHAGFGGFSGGFVGVDIFFVISGYLIGRALFDDADAGRLSILNFYERRCRRILPALLLVIVATLVAALFVLLPSQLVGLAKSVLAAAGFAANFYFWSTQNYFGGVPLSKPLLHLWSLAVEEQYYLFWPVFVGLLYRWGYARWRTPAIMIAMAVSLVATEWLLRQSPTTAFYMLPARAWELLAGALVATGDMPRVRRRAGAEALAALALLLVLVPVVAYDETVRFPGLGAVPPCLGTALLIQLGETARTRTHRLLSLRPLLFVGLLSYSLYLWHWPIFSLAYLAMQRAPTPVESIALILLALVLAWMSWRFVEAPFRTRSAPDRTARSAWHVPAVSVAALLLLSGVALALVASRGLPARLPVAARAVDAVPAETMRVAIGCRFSDAIDDAAVGRCIDDVRRDPRDKIVLWGDSYALHYVDALGEIAARRGLVLAGFVATGCLPTPGVVPAFGRGRADLRCAHFSNRIAREIGTLPGVRAVVIGGRWSNLAGIALPGGVRDPTARFLVRDGTDRRSLPDSIAALSGSLAGIARAMDDRGIPVTLIGEPPFYPDPARTCVAHALWRHEPVARCGSTLAEQRRYRRPMASVFDAARAVSPRVTLYDPLPQLCTPRCLPFRDGQLLTFDTGHLTVAGSRIALRDYALPSPRAPEKPRR